MRPPPPLCPPAGASRPMDRSGGIDDRLFGSRRAPLTAVAAGPCAIMQLLGVHAPPASCSAHLSTRNHCTRRRCTTLVRTSLVKGSSSACGCRHGALRVSSPKAHLVHRTSLKARMRSVALPLERLRGAHTCGSSQRWLARPASSRLPARRDPARRSLQLPRRARPIVKSQSLTVSRQKRWAHCWHPGVKACVAKRLETARLHSPATSGTNKPSDPAVVWSSGMILP